MKGPYLSALVASTGSWVCQRCIRGRRKPAAKTIVYGIKPRKIHLTRSAFGGTRLAAVAAAATGFGAGSFFLTPDGIQRSAKYTYAATIRTGRVLTTLTACIEDYRRTLKKKSDDEEKWTCSLKACHKRCAERTLRAMEKNGSIFIKLGQHLSSMGYLLPEEWVTTFVSLQDHCPVSTYESIEEMFLKDTGASISEYFDTFEKEPIGAASLAQVHVATTKDSGEKVAVKVQHPSLDTWVPLDMALTRFTFSALKRFFPEYDLEWLSSEMDLSLPQELNFALEGENAMITKKHFAKIKGSPLVVPRVMWGQRRLLVMEYLSGHRLDDLNFLDSNGIDRDEVSAALARIFNEMIFGGTPLHCDPHGGNIAIRKNNTRKRAHNFDIILYDHGLYRDIPKGMQRTYAKLWLAVIEADESKMRRYAYEVAGVDDTQFPLFASAITGRDYISATKAVVSTRTDHEKDLIGDAMGDGLLQQLVQLLGKVPRIILLILKTNDLTRSLDENLHTREGPFRNFLILAHYCSRAVFEERIEVVGQYGNIFLPKNLMRLLGAWTSFLRVELRLFLYESLVSLRGFLRLSAVQSI